MKYRALILAAACFGMVAGCGGDSGDDSDPIVDPGPGPGPGPDPGPDPDPDPPPLPAWVQQGSGLIAGFIYNVSFPDAQHGWAVGTHDTFIRTQDGGDTWTPFTKPGDGGVDEVQFVDAIHGWARAYDKLYFTTDGGMTWVQQMVEPGVSFAKLSFLTPAVGWVMAQVYEVYKTTDGGHAWKLQRVELQSHIRAMFAMKFVNSQTGWVVTSDPDAPLAILKTTDGGDTWTTVHLIHDEDIQIYDMDAVGNSAWIVGQIDESPPSWYTVVNAYVIATSDGGATWSEQKAGSSKVLNAVDFVDESNGWTVGDRVYRTSNGGATWELQSPPESDYRDVDFVNATTGWVVGGDGVILKTGGP